MMVLKAPAKVNLYLEILGRRENGYHDISSVLVPVSIYDELTLEKVDAGIETVLDSDGLPDGEVVKLTCPKGNLTDRAAAALARETGYAGGVRIRLRKHIPVGGGLGGGSADAAAVLLGLNTLWGTGVPMARLMEIGAGLGCDVPALTHGGPVLMEGLGERISPLEVCAEALSAGWWLVLANPRFSVSTVDMYARYNPSLTSGKTGLKSIVCALRDGDLSAVAAGLFNSLQGTVFRKFPLIAMMAECITASGALGTVVSGSGATVFGLARHEEHARDLVERIRKRLEFPVWLQVARILPDGVMVAHGPLEA